MFLLIASFLAGVLTSLAPCILPLLPVIVGSSVLQDGDKASGKKMPYIISAKNDAISRNMVCVLGLVLHCV